MPDFKTYCKARVIKTVCYCHKDRQVDQWTRIEFRNKSTSVWTTAFFDASFFISVLPFHPGQLIFDKGSKAVQWRKDDPTKDAGTTGYLFRKITLQSIPHMTYKN